MVPPSIFCLSSLNYDVLWWIKPLDLPQLFAICHNCHCHGFSLQVATYCFIMLPPSIFCFSWLKYDVLWWIEPLDPPQLFAICHNCHCHGFKAVYEILWEYSLQGVANCFVLVPPSIFYFRWLKYNVLWWIEPLDPPQLFAICHNCHCHGFKAVYEILGE